MFDLSCVTYKKLVPSMSWEVIEFFKVTDYSYSRSVSGNTLSVSVLIR
nr:MAG TPA: hypothetical protein [Caudoviricetes sp.]